jgi:hypothetical protein
LYRFRREKFVSFPLVRRKLRHSPRSRRIPRRMHCRVGQGCGTHPKGLALRGAARRAMLGKLSGLDEPRHRSRLPAATIVTRMGRARQGSVGEADRAWPALAEGAKPKKKDPQVRVNTRRRA